MARAFGSYPKCHRFESSRRYHDPHRVSPWRVGQAAKTPPFHGGNTGSIPVRVTTDGWNRSRPFGGLAQLVRAPASHAGGHWFESSSLHQKVPGFVRNQELFLLFLAELFGRVFAILALTQAVTHTERGTERTGQRWTGIFLSGAGFFAYMAWLMTLPIVSAASRFISAVA